MIKPEIVYSWYQSAMRSVGRKISMPQAKDHTKTYLWRSMVAFAKKMDDLDIDEDLAKRMVFIIVDHAKQNRLLNRGASLLAKADLVEICHDKLKDEVNAESELINELKRSALFLEKQRGERDCRIVLTERRKAGAYANITCWHQEGKLTKGFIAISKNCYNALSKLDQDEREEFPSDAEIIKIRYKLLVGSMSDEIEQFMGSDIATGGVK